MWVFTRPRGGQDCYLLTGEIRGGLKFCPIHRFDGMNQILQLRMGTSVKPRRNVFRENSKTGNPQIVMMRSFKNANSWKDSRKQIWTVIALQGRIWCLPKL